MISAAPDRIAADMGSAWQAVPLKTALFADSFLQLQKVVLYYPDRESRGNAFAGPIIVA